MNQLLEWLSRLFDSWKFWVVVPPWDVGVRVRLGKNATALAAGPHLRIPFLDDVLLVNTRLRVGTAPPVTVMLAGGKKSRIVMATVGYRVCSPLDALMRFEHPHIAVLSFAQAEVAKQVTPEQCAIALREAFEGSGVSIEFVRYVEDVEARTLRLLSNSYGLDSGPQQGPPGSAVQERY